MDYTTNYGFAKPEDAARNWGNTMNGNMDLIDQTIYELKQYVLGISSSSSSSSSSESSSSSSESSSSSSSSA